MVVKRIQLIPLLSAVALLSACTVVPGTNLSTSGKTEVATGTVDVDQLADVYPVYLFTRTGLTASVLPGWDNLSSRCTP